MTQNVYDDITAVELGKKLYNCADAIRDTVDETRYKDYILPLVFYKSIDDTFSDRLEDKKEQFAGDEELARKAITDLTVPEDYQWEALTEQSENIDSYIDESFDVLERENDSLSGVVRVTYSDEDALTDQRLRDLIQRINRFELSTERVEKDFLGEAYMYMVGEFAKDEGKDGGQFFTPPDVLDLGVRLLAESGDQDGFDKGASFHDPTAGSAGFLVHAASYARNNNAGEPSTWTITGQELNADIAAIAQVNTFLHGLDAEIRREDSLDDPAFPTYLHDDEGFDYVLANFPFSSDWSKGDLKDDKWDRFDWADKLPRADRGDYAFIMHIEKLLNNRGRAAIVIPHGVLFRTNEGRYRKTMIEEDMIEAIIALPDNLFQNNSIPSAYLILNKDKRENCKGQIEFIHADDEQFYRDVSNQNKITDEGVNHIVQNFSDWITEEGVSRTVSLDEVRENDYNLNVALYVDTTGQEEDINATDELAKLRTTQAERDELEAQMTQHMEALNYE